MLMSTDKFPQHVAVTNNYNIILPVLHNLRILQTIWAGMEFWSECNNREVNSSLLFLPEEVCVERWSLWVHIILFIVPTAISQIHRAKAWAWSCFCSHCKGAALTEECVLLIQAQTSFRQTIFFLCSFPAREGGWQATDYEILWKWRTKHHI